MYKSVVAKVIFNTPHLNVTFALTPEEDKPTYCIYIT